MRAIRLKRWWDGVPVTILTPGVDRVEGSNTISDDPIADCVWDPAYILQTEKGVIHCVIHKRNMLVCTVETGCKCGAYDITDLKAVHHFVKRIDAMVEIAVKLGSKVIYCGVIDELNGALVKKVRSLGIKLIKPVYPAEEVDSAIEDDQEGYQGENIV